MSISWTEVVTVDRCWCCFPPRRQPIIHLACSFTCSPGANAPIQQRTTFPKQRDVQVVVGVAGSREGGGGVLSSPAMVERRPLECPHHHHLSRVLACAISPALARRFAPRSRRLLTSTSTSMSKGCRSRRGGEGSIWYDRGRGANLRAKWTTNRVHTWVDTCRGPRSRAGLPFRSSSSCLFCSTQGHLSACSWSRRQCSRRRPRGTKSRCTSRPLPGRCCPLNI